MNIRSKIYRWKITDQPKLEASSLVIAQSHWCWWHFISSENGIVTFWKHYKMKHNIQYPLNRSKFETYWKNALNTNLEEWVYSFIQLFYQSFGYLKANLGFERYFTEERISKDEINLLGTGIIKVMGKVLIGKINT